jgi:hypothetical protein
MLGSGEPVLWRKCWNGVVMTALPMRVVSDSSERTVLYLAPNTAFKGARTAAGTKVRDLSNWVSKDLVWAGGHLTADVEDKVRAEADRMIGVLAADGPPFCESERLRWLPPADWTVPALPEDWAE